MLMRLLRPALALLAALGLTLLPRFITPDELRPPSVSTSDNTPPARSGLAPTFTPPPPAPAAAFADWLASYQSTPPAERSALLAEGRILALARREHLATLIRANPAQALRERLRLHDYAALPSELRPLVERPFSVVAAFDSYPICHAPTDTADHLATLHLPEGTANAFTYGTRKEWMSKRSAPVQGIVLDGSAALHEHALLTLEPAEVATARAWFPPAQTDLARSFLTGLPIAGEPVLALGGGRLHAFANPHELDTLNQTLAQLDALPGPHAGSDALYAAAPAPGAEAGGFDLTGAIAAEQAQASAWTEQPKRVFMIRVDFSDRTGESHSQTATLGVLRDVVAPQIRAMSYGKTDILPGVSALTYRLPQTAAYYVNAAGSSSLNAELLRDARNTFRNTRAGDDSAINIGPVSATGNGDSAGLGDYDIVGVLFASLGMRSTIVYGGLAGGSNLWMQGNIDDGVFTHELGHNYGIGHASFWLTSDGSVTGAGANDEYGDPYDIMGSGELPEGHFHPQAKARLNWLASTDWSDATALGSATYRLHRIDHAQTAASPRGVRITRSGAAGAQEYLWLGYRPAYAGRPLLERGAYLIWQRPAETRSWLLDTTPATRDDVSDAPIAIGRTYADAASGAFITPLTTGGEGADAYLDVRVNFGPFSANQPPTAGTLDGPAVVVARTAPVYTLSGANDPDGDALAYAWNAGDGSVPDNQASATPEWIVGGSYPLSVTVSDMKGGLATASRTVTVTDPLDTWAVGSVGATTDLRRALFARGRFLAAGYWGETYLSWDGATWESIGQPPAIDQPRFAAGPSTFVAAGLLENDNTRGQLCWSPDGRRWRTATFPAGIPAVREVCYADSRFLAVGDDGTVLSSADGISWTVTTVATTPDFQRLAHTGTTWIAVATLPANNRPETVWTSTDGLAWTRGPDLGVDVFSLTTDHGLAYVAGWYAGVMVSADQGQTWADAALPSGTRWTTYQIAAATDGTLVCPARAMDESGQPGALLVSVDGLRWVRSSAGGELANADALVFGHGRFLAADDDGVIRRSGPFYPANIAPSGDFTQAPASAHARQAFALAASATDADNDPLTYVWDFGTQLDARDGSAFTHTYPFGGSYTITLRVSDGRGGLTTRSHALTIADPARTFADRSVTAQVPGDFQAVASGGGRIVAVGSQIGGTFTGPRAWSTDGITWQTGNLGANQHLYGLIHDGTRFIGAGTRYDFNTPAGYRGWITTSTDGVTWTQRYFAGPWLEVVATGGGVYLAAGEDGALVRSVDGLTWSAVAIPGVTTDVTFDGLAWNGSVFLLTGYTGSNGGVRAYTSTDGLTWMDQAAGTGVDSWQDLRRAAWLNDRFVASGWYSRLRVSTNHGATFSSNRQNYEQTPAMTYGAGIYFAAGINQSASDADIDLLSLDGVTWQSFAAPTTKNRRAAHYFNDTFVVVGDGGSIWQSDPLTPAPTGFAGWQVSTFPGGGPSALPTADPDGDGLPNLLEYALDLDPLASAPAFLTAQRVSGRTTLAFTIPEPSPTDLIYQVEGRSDLISGDWSVLARKIGIGAWTWQASGPNRVVIGAPDNGRVPVQVSAPDADASSPRYFMRLKVESL